MCGHEMIMVKDDVRKRTGQAGRVPGGQDNLVSIVVVASASPILVLMSFSLGV